MASDDAKERPDLADAEVRSPPRPRRASRRPQYDPDNPEAILGARVSVEWANKRCARAACADARARCNDSARSSYDGTVMEYDPRLQQHYVLYDDGDRRWGALHRARIGD
jgi:hypothetical protein